MTAYKETIELFGGPADGERVSVSTGDGTVRKPWYDGSKYLTSRTVPYHRLEDEELFAVWCRRAKDGTRRYMVEKGRSA